MEDAAYSRLRVVVLRRLGPCENAQSTVIVLPSNSNLQQKNVQRNCSAAGQRRLRETDPLAPSMAACASYGFFQAKSGGGGGETKHRPAWFHILQKRIL